MYGKYLYNYVCMVVNIFLLLPSTYLFSVYISMIMMYPFLIHSGEAILNSLAQELGFSIRDVPRDGDCLFSAVAVQLNSLGIQPGETNLREQLVEYLEAHPYTQGILLKTKKHLNIKLNSEDCLVIASCREKI